MFPKKTHIRKIAKVPLYLTKNLGLLFFFIEVLKDIKKAIRFTTRGNVDIGNCVLLQRKGGNGSMSKTIPKTDIKHPGNNIQIKLKVDKFVKEMEHNLIGQYSI